MVRAKRIERALSTLLSTTNMPSAVEAFLQSVDKDCSGTIDTKELLAALGESGLDEKLVQEFINEHDKDHDGQLNLKELKDFLASCGCL
ncbi:Calcium-binding protein 2 [Echinococcus granulosus]|nr:Calcium-binding protein 2 [Echinococcus granulosus]